MQKQKEKVLLVGEGIHQHTLKGEFTIDDERYALINVLKPSILHHEKPNGEFSKEHFPISVEKGVWIQGRQTEYNPFTREFEDIWD